MKCASIEGIDKTLGRLSAGLVFAVGKCNLRVAKIAGEPAGPVDYPQNRLYLLMDPGVTKTLMRVICEA